MIYFESKDIHDTELTVILSTFFCFSKKKWGFFISFINLLLWELKNIDKKTKKWQKTYDFVGCKVFWAKAKNSHQKERNSSNQKKIIC